MKNIGHTQDWLSCYAQSDLYRCHQSGFNCSNFHVLSPILHDLSLNSTYNLYPLPVIRVLNQVFLFRGKINILVLGIESEISAKALLRILDLFRNQFTITFIDICEPPLVRIQAALSRTEQAFVKTRVVDFRSPGSDFPGNKFDVIFSDIFLKQFAQKDKVSILNNMAKLLRDANSAVLLRENIGNIHEIIDRWYEVKIIPSMDKLCTMHGDPIVFRNMFDDLVNQFKNGGYVYPNFQDLKSDIAMSSLKINNHFFNNAAYYNILHLGI